jgi:hypothetical protein
MAIVRARSLHKAAAVLTLALLALCPSVLFGQSPVPTYHADNTRSGLYNTETLLAPTNVNSVQFGKLFLYPVDGFIVGQPLYMPNVTISGGVHNVVYVATQNNSVYAIDADTWSTLWSMNFGTPVPISAQGCTSTGFVQNGIMGTPAISGTTGTIYFVAKTVSGTSYNFYVHALDITTGLDKFGSPVEVQASLIAPDGNTVTFQSEAKTLMQRPALLLQNDVLYIGFGSNGCDLGVQGWLFAFDSGVGSGLLQQLAFANTAPDVAYGASIWMSGDGPAGDGNGNVFFSTANGTFDFSTGGPDFGDTILKASYSAGSLNLPTLTSETADYFTPFDQSNMAAQDLDLGSGGPLILPPQPPPHQNVLVTAGKWGGIYLLDMDNLGGCCTPNNTQIVQYFPEKTLGPFYSTPVYWNNMVYFAGNGDYLKAFTLSNGQLSTSPTVVSKSTTSGGTPIVSANQNANGIVWMVANPTKPILEAMNATTLTLLYNSAQAANNRDSLGGLTAHFATPLVANGRVYVGTQKALAVYGLFPILSVTAGNGQSGNVGTTLPHPIQVQALNSLRAPVPGVTVTFSDGGVGGAFSNPTVVTDSTGTASTSYTLPTKPQTVFITATGTISNFPVSATLVVTAVAGPPATITLVSGGSQSGTVNTQLPAPIVVQLQDTYHNPVPGLLVHFSDNNGKGSFSVNPVKTDSNGNATVYYTLPTVAKVLNLSAVYAALKVNFAETSVAGSPATVKVVSGNNQTAPPNTQLPKALIVLVTDQYGNRIAGVNVTFSDNGAHGTFSANPVMTNSLGQASVNYTTGSQTGAITITASVPGASSATFNETVQ